MIIVGLTGGLSSGKTTVASMFESLGAMVLNADNIAHQLLGSPRVSKRVVDRFGKAILHQGKVDRVKLAQVVFNNPKKLRILEKIIHPLVIREIKTVIAALRTRRKNKMLIMDVPLLFESGLDALADVNIVVKANQKIQIARSTRRFAISRNEALKRMTVQMPLKKKLVLADIVIDNRGTRMQTKKQVKQIFERLTRIKNK